MSPKSFIPENDDVKKYFRKSAVARANLACPCANSNLRGFFWLEIRSNSHGHSVVKRQSSYYYTDSRRGENGEKDRQNDNKNGWNLFQDFWNGSLPFLHSAYFTA